MQSLASSMPLAPRRDERQPFIEFGYDGDGGAGERSIAEVVAGTRTATRSRCCWASRAGG